MKKIYHPRMDDKTIKIYEDSRFLEFFDLLMKLEGFSSNHPSDKGGVTMRGVTLKTWRNWKGDQNATFENSSIVEFKQLYYEEYYQKVPKHTNAEVHYHYFDMNVNSGYKNAHLLIHDCHQAFKCYEWRSLYFKKLVMKNFNQYMFFKGWLNRLLTIAKYFEVEKNINYMKNVIAPYKLLTPKNYIFQIEKELIEIEKTY